MGIKVRDNFSDIPAEVAYVTYVPYDKTPSCEDYVYGKKGTIVLKNASTNELEQINYKLIGAIPFIYRSGYQSFWGEIETDDRLCCLVFNFKLNGDIESITASFSSKSPTVSEISQMNEKITYAAQITAIGDFGPIPF